MRRAAPQPDSNAVVRATPAAVAPVISGPMIATKPEPWASKWVKRPAVAFFSMLFALWQKRITHEVHIKGGEWTQTLEPGRPLVWLATHQTSLDFVNLFPLQRRIPGKPDFKIAARTLKGGAFAKIGNWVMQKTICFQLHRTKMGEGGTEAQQAAMRAANAETMAAIRDRFGWGGHVLVFPEGTTMTNGRIVEVKKGFMSLIRVPQADGTERVVSVAPVGYTLDLLAGPRGKYLNFINSGAPMTYTPVDPLPGESAEAYRRRDAEDFAGKVHARLLSLTTVTASQLAGVYLMDRTELSPDALFGFLHGKALAAAAAGYHVDDALLDLGACRERFEQLWKNLVREGYVNQGDDGRWCVNQERYRREKLNMKFEADNPYRYKGYKQDNPLRYCANRLLQVMESDSRMRDIVRA